MSLLTPKNSRQVCESDATSAHACISEKTESICEHSRAQAEEIAARKAPSAPANSAELHPGEYVYGACETVGRSVRAGNLWVEEPVAYDAVILASFGGPDGQADVVPFLRNVTAGRGIPDERLEEVAVHYRLNGGVSPINEQNMRLREALEEELNSRGFTIPVYLGNRNWAPYTHEAVEEAYRAGHRTLLAVTTSAYSGYSSCRQYREDFANALEHTGLRGAVTVDKIREYFNHPGFLTPFIEDLTQAYVRLLEEGHAPKNIEVLFTTHSIPCADNARSGPNMREVLAGTVSKNTVAGIDSISERVVAGIDSVSECAASTHGTIPEHVPSDVGSEPEYTTTSVVHHNAGSKDCVDSIHSCTTTIEDVVAACQEYGLYVQQHSEAIDAVRGEVENRVGQRLNYRLVYQSRSGPPHVPWLEPDINDVIEELPGQGRTAVVVVPIGFVSDHMEVLWDLDNEARATAAKCGLAFIRTATPELNPMFIRGLADLVEERLKGTPRAQRPALTPLGPAPDICPAGSCRHSRRPEAPAIAGIPSEI